MLRKIILAIVLAFCCIDGKILAGTKIVKEDLKVLYVGYNPNLPLPKFATLRNDANYQADYKERMPAFKTLLEKYFTSVETVDARDYREDMSKNFNVTIFDALPKPIKPTEMQEDPIFGTSIKCQGEYLTKDFDSPALFVGFVADEIGHSLGLKEYWYCLCLFYHAVNVRIDHPIFHKPFKVNLTFTNRPTPEDFYNYSQDWVLPREIPMWRVERDSSRIGMVSGWYGINEGNDAEIISGGHCMKSYENMAIGRHGNYFMWGFGAAPNRMTEEAKVVFANAVSYINHFKGEKPVVRKYGFPLMRDKVRDFYQVLTPEGYQTYVKGVDHYNKWLLKHQSNIKKTKGNLTPWEQMISKELPMEKKSHLEYVKRCSQFGLIYDCDMNIESARNFLDENMDYFLGATNRKTDLEVDEDVKSLRIPNNDIRLLEKCISMLEQKQDMEKALRILRRYTYQKFDTAKDWRNWYTTYKNKLFFSELADYKFLGDGSECKAPVVKENPPKEKVVNITSEVVGTGKERELRVKFKIAEGHHIYASAVEGCPMYLTKIEITTTPGIEKDGDLILPKCEKYTSEVNVYRGEVEFVQKLKIRADKIDKEAIVCQCNYQCCNDDLCMDPEQQLFILKLK